jgi:hypothetical protein
MLHIRIDVDLHCVVVQIFKFSLQAKINEYLGIFLLYCQQVMACGTIVGNCLTVRADVRPNSRSLDDMPSGGLAIRIVCLQYFHSFFVDVRKLRIDQPSRHPQVNPIFRHSNACVGRLWQSRYALI